MGRTPSIEKKIGAVLLAGTLFSMAVVLIGGIWYLSQFGNDNVQFELLRSMPKSRSIDEIWRVALSFTPLGIVELGLLLLVATQLLRVAMLCVFYAIIGDYGFTSISCFVLLVLIYSFIWH
jgi:uncharacterized membrane protein